MSAAVTRATTAIPVADQPPSVTWCDDLCEDYGDCCGDKAMLCDDDINMCDLFTGPCQNDDDCGDGFQCIFDPSTCSPSACGCDPVTGSIMCTADCGGKECVPDTSAECETGLDCYELYGAPVIECVGAHWECTTEGTCSQSC